MRVVRAEQEHLRCVGQEALVLHGVHVDAPDRDRVHLGVHPAVPARQKTKTTNPTPDTLDTLDTLAFADFDRDGDIDVIDGTKWYRNDNIPFEISQSQFTQARKSAEIVLTRKGRGVFGKPVVARALWEFDKRDDRGTESAQHSHRPGDA